MRKILFLSLVFLSAFFAEISFSNEQLLQSGPMVGQAGSKEVLLWVQTKKEAKVKFSYWDKELPRNKLFTREILTGNETAYTAKIIADKLTPGKTYVYELYINGLKVERPMS